MGDVHGLVQKSSLTSSNYLDPFSHFPLQAEEVVLKKKESISAASISQLLVLVYEDEI
jgi:hypothetical protein